jgi:hypothetical protein
LLVRLWLGADSGALITIAGIAPSDYVAGK